MKTVVSLAIACLVLAACSSAPKKEEAPVPPPKAMMSAPVTLAPVAPPAETEAARLSRMAKELSNKSVYFDFDDFTVRTEYQDVVKSQADFVRGATSDKVLLQGNADERGSTEYNLALGQKRAEAVRKALTILGVPDGRLEAVSYGKEKPRLACHEEKCWKENRRVDFDHKLQ